jgi:hypothetical protein
LIEDNHEILQVLMDEEHEDKLIIEQPNKYKVSNAQLKKEIFAIRDCIQHLEMTLAVEVHNMHAEYNEDVTREEIIAFWKTKRLERDHTKGMNLDEL